MWGLGSLQNIEPTKTQFLYINRSDVPTNGKNDRPKNDRQHRYATKDRVNDRQVTARLHGSDGKLKMIDEWVEWEDESGFLFYHNSHIGFTT